MLELERLKQLFFESLTVFGSKFMELIPGLVSGGLVLLIAWLLARLVSSGFERILRFIKFNEFSERMQITHFLRQVGISLSPSAFIGRVIYWIFVLLIIASVAQTLKWTVVSDQINRVLEYLPNLFSALLFFVVGSYAASFVRDFLRTSMGSLGISTARIISTAVYYLLFVMVILTAMQQGGFDTKIIWSNMLLIIGAIMFSAAISYGFASREVLSNILASFYTRRTFYKGMTIEVEGVRGLIVEMNNVSVTIEIEVGEYMVIPSRILLNSKVKIIRKN